MKRARQLKEVVREDVKSYRSDWKSGETVDMHTVVLPGLELCFAVHREGEPFLTSATYTQPSWVLPGGIAVGMKMDEVQRLLGKGSVDGGIVRNEKPGEGFVEFTSQGGRVMQIRLTPYTG